MKKNLLFLTLIMALVLVACGGQSATETEAPPEPTTQAAEPTAAPVVEEAGESEEMAPADTESLMASTWQWVSFTNPVEQFDVENPENYTLAFMEDGTVSIKADCNNALGAYTVDGSSITIEVGPMTMAACPPESRSDAFVTYLGSSAIFFFEDGNLFIDLMADGGTMEFAPLSGEALLLANPWQWVAFTNPVEQFDVENPENYTLTFNEDGTVSIKADCNNAIGSYTVDGSSITIEVGPMTMAACPPESRSDAFVTYLGSSAIFFFDGGNLFIDLFADGGTMEFAPGVMGSTGMEESEAAITLTSHTWELDSYVLPDGVTVIDNPENYTLTFNEDGTVSIVADCNNAIGTYTDDGSSLSIEVGPMTLAECPPESHSEEFINLLGSTGNYELVQGYLFIGQADSNGIMNFNLQQIMTEEFTPDADPIFATLTMGSKDNLFIDPLLVSMTGGLVEGYGVDATTLGEACTGTIPPRPDVVFYWPEDEYIDMLRVFFLSVGDPTMVLVTPSGEVLCNDDYNPLMLDPYIEIKNPQPGRYAAFLGHFEKDMEVPGFLVVTTQDLNPATLDIAQLLPREVDPRAISEPLPLDVLEVDSDTAATPPNGTLTPADLVYQQELTAGGEIGAFNIEHENALCTGFISAAPTFRFDWSGDLENLVIFFESNVDTTLQVLAPDGTFHCDDDYSGAENLNPWLSFTPMEGTYHIWVGSFSPDVLASGTLTITSDAEATPVPLTSNDIQQ